MGRFSHLYHRHIPKQLRRETRIVRSTSGGAQRVLLPSEAGAASYALSEQLEKEQPSPAAAMSTLLSHAGLSSMHNVGAMHNQPLSPPIQLATTYERPANGDYGDGWIYSRQSNPTRKLLEDVMGQLETAATVNAFDMNSSQYDVSKTASGFAFSSGMAAISSLIFAHKSPVRVLIPKDVYHGVPTQFSVVLNDHGVLHRAVDMTNFEKLHEIIDEEVANNSSGREGSLIVWMETPSNPLCQVTDVQKICDMVSQIRSVSTNDEFRITSVVDSTWAPPCITQPLKLGADAVIHSGTKYLGGHSDVLLGLVCTSPYTVEGNWLSERVSSTQTSIGAVADPFSCWLTLRGLRTLHLRVERSCRSALEIANYLKKSHADVVVKVHYPGLTTHPEHAIAKRQMNALYGGMLSFEVKSEVMAMAVAGAVKIIRRATSLGGTESLLEHRAVS